MPSSGRSRSSRTSRSSGRGGASGGGGGELGALRDLFKRPAFSEVAYHRGAVECLDWDCEGDRLGSGSTDKTACVMKLTDRLVKDTELRGHTGSVDFLTWHPSNKSVLATASSDHHVKFWDVRTGARCVATVPTKRPNICVRYCPDGSTLAVINLEDTLMLIDSKTGKVFKTKQFNYEVNEFTWDKSGNYLFLTNRQGCVEVYTFPELAPTDVQLTAHTASCTCINFDPTHTYLATGSTDTTVTIFDADELICTRGIADYECTVKHIHFSHDGRLLTASTDDANLCVYHVESGEEVGRLDVPNATAMAWHPKKTLLAYRNNKPGRVGSVALLGSLK